MAFGGELGLAGIISEGLAVGGLLLAQSAQPPAGAAAAAGAASHTPTLLDYIRDGGLVGYILIAISVAALGLMIRNMIVIRLKSLAPPIIVGQLQTLVSNGRLGEAAQYCTKPENRCFVTVAMGRAFSRCAGSPVGLGEFRGAVEESAQAEAEELYRLNDGIGIIAAVGPMLGLLGTVIGMVGAFRTIGSLEGAARSTQLATFMSMALVNTAQGLIVAIPCTIVFALFKRRIDRVLQQLGLQLEAMSKLVVLQAAGVRRAPASNGSATPAAAPQQAAGASA